MQQTKVGNKRNHFQRKTEEIANLRLATFVLKVLRINKVLSHGKCLIVLY